jgi:hypothetical protein
VPETPADEIHPEPPIGEPIPIERPVGDDQSDAPGEGEHVVVTPFTAGSAGAAHKEN